MGEKRKIPPQRIKPFRKIADSFTPGFVELAEEMLFLVREHGISKAGGRPETKEAFATFVRYVYEGWKSAQEKIAENLIIRLDRQKALRDEAKEHRRNRSREAAQRAESSENQLTLEICVLRRMLDVALWTLLAGEHSTLRRLFVAGGEHNLSPETIRGAMPTANQLNSNPNVIALCTDMLSQVHVGDLLVVDWREPALNFVELKAGDKNFEIGKAASFAVQSQCEHFDNAYLSQFEATDKAHYNRAKRQAQRNATIVNTLRDEKGSDPNTGAVVTITELDEPPTFWVDTINRLYSELSAKKTWAIASLDGCLHVGVYSDIKVGFVGFNAWMDKIKCGSRIYNLTDSFFLPSSRPLGATFLSLELHKKILRGEVAVIICLDIEKMISATNQLHPGFLSFASRREAAQMRKHKLRMLEHDGKLIKASVGQNSNLLGGGFIDRVVFDQQRPAQLLEVHYKQLAAADGEPIADPNDK